MQRPRKLQQIKRSRKQQLHDMPPVWQTWPQDYWERQGEHWIRHHISLRNTLFTPTLKPHRTTITNNNFGEVSQRKDDWTVIGDAELPFQWKGTTRFTIKKDNENLQENYDEEQQHEHHEARQPPQPTPQQIAEPNLTHLPCRNWCPIITTTHSSSRLCLYQLTTRPKDHASLNSS